MLRIVPHTAPRVGRSYEHFPDGFELHLLPVLGSPVVNYVGKQSNPLKAPRSFRAGPDTGSQGWGLEHGA